MRILSVLVIAGVLTSLAGLYVVKLVVTDNFHTVIEARLYRSALPGGGDLDRWHARYGIATVVNLIGAKPGSDWYESERAAIARNGMTLIDYHLSAHKQLRPGQVEELIALLSEAKAPILIHCYRGADRTSLVSALYVAAVAKRSEFSAEFQFAPVYGHVSLPFLPAFAMDRSWRAAEPMLGFPSS